MSDDEGKPLPWWVDPPLLQAEPEPPLARRGSPFRRGMRKLWRVVGPPLVLTSVWGAFAGWTFVAEVALEAGINPLALTLERELLALPVMFAYARWAAGPWMPSPSNAPPLLLIGLLSFGSTVGAIEALKYTPAWASALANLCVPAVTLGLSWLFGMERPQRWRVAGVTTATAGALAAQWWYSFRSDGSSGSGGSGSGTDHSSMWWVGLLLLLVQTACLAGLSVAIAAFVGGYGYGGYGLVEGRRYSYVAVHAHADDDSSGCGTADVIEEACPPAWVTFWYYLIGTTCTAIACGITSTSLRDFGLRGRAEPWLATLYGAVVVSCYCWNAVTWALGRLPPALVMSTVALQPVLTGAIAVLSGRGSGGGGVAAAPEAIGAAAVAAGLAMVWAGYKGSRRKAGAGGGGGARRVEPSWQWDFRNGETKPLLGGAHWSEEPPAAEGEPVDV